MRHLSPGRHKGYSKRQSKGYTLIELVMVIVLLSIVAFGSVQFVAFSTQGALDVSNRQQRAMAAVVVSEQISRALRGALPGSVRITADQRCIEFMPVLSASRYVAVPIASAASQFAAAAIPNGPVSGRLVVYPLGGGNLYSPTSPGVITPQNASVPAGINQITVTLGAAHQFLTDSPTRRFFVVGTPQAFCQSGDALYRYSNYGLIANVGALQGALPTTAPNRELVVRPLLANSALFNYVPESLQRNGVATFAFVLTDDDSTETLDVTQEVQIRNVP